MIFISANPASLAQFPDDHFEVRSVNQLVGVGLCLAFGQVRHKRHEAVDVGVHLVVGQDKKVGLAAQPGGVQGGDVFVFQQLLELAVELFHPEDGVRRQVGVRGPAIQVMLAVSAGESSRRNRLFG